VQTTRLLVEAMARQQQKPAVLVNGSAVGVYGSSPKQRFAETSPAAEDVLGRLCSQWEAAAAEAAAFSRVVTLRIGIVLGADGGALGKYVAGVPGRFRWPDRHREAMDELDPAQRPLPVDRLGARGSGFWRVYNAVAPNPVLMKEFAAALGKALGRPSFLPVPAPVLQLMLGDGAQVVLEGQYVLAERLQHQGFNFRYPDLAGALAAATTPAPR